MRKSRRLSQFTAKPFDATFGRNPLKFEFTQSLRQSRIFCQGQPRPVFDQFRVSSAEFRPEQLDIPAEVFHLFIAPLQLAGQFPNLCRGGFVGPSARLFEIAFYDRVDDFRGILGRCADHLDFNQLAVEPIDDVDFFIHHELGRCAVLKLCELENFRILRNSIRENVRGFDQLHMRAFDLVDTEGVERWAEDAGPGRLDSQEGKR